MSEKKISYENDTDHLVRKLSDEVLPHPNKVPPFSSSLNKTNIGEQNTCDRADADSMDSGIGLIDIGQRQPGVGLDAVSSNNIQERQRPTGNSQGEPPAFSRRLSNKADSKVRPVPEGAQTNGSQPQATYGTQSQTNLPQVTYGTQSQTNLPQISQSPELQTVIPSSKHSSLPKLLAETKEENPAPEDVGIKSGLETTVGLGTVGIKIHLKNPEKDHFNCDVSDGCEKSSSVESVPNEHTDIQVELRRTPTRRNMKHSNSETDAITEARRRSQSMAEIKEHAYQRLQEELFKAQTDLKLKDEEVGKLSKVRYQMEQELDDLTASLFEEANKMVQDANVKRMHTEKLLQEATQQIEVLQAEVVALKQLVLTSTPSSPNKHLHPQIADGKDKKSSKPFWKTHRRSTSHHEFTKESRQQAEAQQGKEPVSCKEFDTVCYDEFLKWRHNEEMEGSEIFVQRVKLEDIGPCLNFSNKKLSERVQECVDRNTLTIEPIPVQNSYPRKCLLTETNKLCNYRIKLDDCQNWYSISQMCRNRIASVCDFYTYIRYIRQGLVKTEDKEAFLEIVRLRRQMALTRLGLA